MRKGGRGGREIAWRMKKQGKGKQKKDKEEEGKGSNITCKRRVGVIKGTRAENEVSRECHGVDPMCMSSELSA